ncbi:MAG TPA: hypothetical protein VNK43_01220 [Gemmatimonadales bacterium]|nr:hypothetical protein [Gemmatimonadales bacterium]
MKRTALLTLAAALALGSTAEAQLTMQMSNGWSFTFAGNVNAFATFETQDEDGTSAPPGGLVGANPDAATRIRTGLLPAFAVFDAKGREGNTDLGVHFGFAPQINCAAAQHDCFGAQIDMRQVYLTVGGSWGQILAGREIGLFNRQNILNDQTLFGVGATGGSDPGTGAGTTLGRIGFGYIYPNFKAQLTYSTPAGRPLSWSIGLFEAAANGPYIVNELPRVETEVVWSSGNTKIWGNGLIQSTKTPDAAGGERATAFGLGGGFRLGTANVALTAAGYWGKGLGTTLLFNGTDGEGNVDGGTGGTGAGGSDDLRDSFGGYGQVTFTPTDSKVTLAGSWGISIMENADTEAEFKTKNWLASGGVYYQATKSLKVVGEFNYAVTGDDDDATDDNKSIVPTVGFMLFF